MPNSECGRRKVPIRDQTAALCGPVHRQRHPCTLVAALLMLAAWIWLTAPRGGKNPHANQKLPGQRSFVSGRSVRAQTGRSSTPAATPIATPTPLASPTPLPIPKTGIVWSQTSTGVYFYQEPGVGILVLIPNGTLVELLEEWAVYGHLPWAQIEWEGQSGWIEATQVSRVRFEGETFYQVNPAGGANLYQAPQGQKIIWLPRGSPLRYHKANQDWAFVSTLGPETGWIALDKIAPPGEFQP